MPRRQRREVPRWRRGQPGPLSRPVQLSRRQAEAFAREYARQHALVSDPGAAAAAVRRSGAWRFRNHLAPFAWLAALTAAAGLLHLTGHAVAFSFPAGLALSALLVWSTRHLSRFARRASDAAALCFAVWLPPLTAFGTTRPVPAVLAASWAAGLAVWVRHYRWRHARAAEPSAPEPAETTDYTRWKALAAERKWNGSLGTPEALGGGGSRYPIQLDGIKTTIGSLLSASENVAGAWHKPMTEAYVERDPQGITSRGFLTILGRETLMEGREWDGAGIDPQTGLAVIGRYADGTPAHVKFYTPRYGTRHAIVSGTTGSGKTELLNLLIFVSLVTGRFVPVVLDPQEGQSLPFWRDRCLYAAGVEECHRMLRGLHAGMLDRSQYLAGLRWDDDGIPMTGMPFFDYEITGLPMPLIIFDEAHMALKGRNKLEQQIVEQTVEIGRLGRKTGTALWLATHLPSVGELGGEQALRDMLRGGNVISMRTANTVGAGMLGLTKDPSEIPPFFANGKETYGVGYCAGPDNRPDAPMRSDLVPKAMRHRVPAVPRLDDRFLAAMDRAMRGVAAGPPADPAPVPADDAPEGRRCIDAVWQVLTESGRPMERGDIIWAVNQLAQAWDRKPWVIRSVTDALGKLAAGADGRTATKIREGVYQAAVTAREGN